VNAQPLVSVVTPTKNRLALLRETMDSVAAQTFPEWEHLVVDDGSDDGTPDEVRTRSAADPRIRYIPRTADKAGANVCRNIGIAESRAALLIFLDSDDLLRPQCIEQRLEIMRRNTILDFAVFRAGVFAKSVGDLNRLYHSQNPGDDLLRFLTLECPWQTSGPIWRRAFLDKVGRFDEMLLSMQDLELHLRALCARAKYVCFPDIDHDIRWQDDATKTSVRHFQDPIFIEAAEGAQVKLLNTLTRSGLLTWSRQRALLGLTFGVAESCVRATGLVDGMRIWNRGCSRQHAPMSLQVAGLLMLYAVRQGVTPDGFCLRLVNKWKGWMRFREEPLLMERVQENSAERPNDCAA
jgi:glycosyltransferase involved in cell wall biosynthesis